MNDEVKSSSQEKDYSHSESSVSEASRPLIDTIRFSLNGNDNGVGKGEATKLPETAALKADVRGPFSATPMTMEPADPAVRPPEPRSPIPQYFQKFEILETRGGGGMGVVFKARDITLNRIVALKMLRNTLIPNSDELERFRREAQAISQLAHPNIVPLLEFGEFRGTPYYVMLLAEGGTLSGWRKRQPQSQQRIAATIEKIAWAVDYAHRHGIIHRDIKPSNILLTVEGEPMLADFGLAHLSNISQQLTPTDFLLGTPTYMAPEQIRGSRVDSRADIWSLGIVLYELLTGNLPFEDSDRGALFVKIATHQPPRLSTPERPVDRALERIVFRCLEKQPDDRYQTAGQLAADLAAWQRGEAPSQSWVEWASKWARRMRRHPLRAAAFMLLLGLAVICTPIVMTTLDELAPLRQDIAALERGEPITLIGPIGGPDWYRCHPENYVALVPSTVASLRMASATGQPAFLELFPKPLPSHFRVEVELPHLSPLHPLQGDSRVMVNPGTESMVSHMEERGLFLAGSILEENGIKQITALIIILEQHPLSVRNSQSSEIQRIARIELRHTEWRLSDNYVSQTSFQYPKAQLSFTISPPRDAKSSSAWHHLSAEVTPESITAWLDGHQIGRITGPEELMALRALCSQKGAKGQPLQPLWQRDGSVGLLLRMSDTTVRNFKITPINR
jgi:tRNA A-37 threonylcarbamoyl transferase component Bud32